MNREYITIEKHDDKVKISMDACFTVVSISLMPDSAVQVAESILEAVGELTQDGLD